MQHLLIAVPDLIFLNSWRGKVHRTPEIGAWKRKEKKKEGREQAKKKKNGVSLSFVQIGKKEKADKGYATRLVDAGRKHRRRNI